MLNMSEDSSRANVRTDTHSDDNSDTENTSHIIDYRTEANLSLTMPTPGMTQGLGQHGDFRLPESDDSSCDGDAEHSPTPRDKQYKSEPLHADQLHMNAGKGMSSLHY